MNTPLYSPTLEGMSFLPTYVTHAPSVRSMGTTVDGDTLDAFSQATANGRSITTASLNEIAPSLLTYGQALGTATIDNGFEERRYIVLLRFVTRFPAYSLTEVFTGYTDMIDVSFGGHIAPETRIMLNAHTSYRTLNGGGGWIPIGSSNILVPLKVNTGAEGIYTLSNFARPVDAMRTVAVTDSPMYESMINGYQAEFGSSLRKIPIRDDRNLVHMGKATSSREDKVVGSYLDSMFRTYKKAKATNHHYGETKDIYDTAADFLTSESGTMDQISEAFRVLSEQTSYGIDHSLSIRELERVFPSAVYILREPGTVQPITDDIDFRNYSNHNMGNDNETGLAAQISTVVTEAMATSLLESCDFSMENWTHAYEVDPVSILPTSGGFVFSISGIPQVEKDHRIDNFLTRVKSRLDPVLRRSTDVYTIKVSGQIRGLIKMEIRLGASETFEPYVEPAYCDQLYTPMAQSSAASVNLIANDFSRLLEKIGE